MASMLWWPDGLCAALARAGRFVIRYDNRDTGRSTAYEPGAPPHTFDDLVADAAAVLDGYGLDRAHLVGMSMGGVIAQLLDVTAVRPGGNAPEPALRSPSR
jgi:pimeloyl-ACP methyl ester carboxylesterase